MHKPPVYSALDFCSAAAVVILSLVVSIRPAEAQAPNATTDLAELAPSAFDGWQKAAQYPADQVGLDAHPGAIEGLFVEFTKPPPSGSMVTYHDLFIDLYRYRTKSQAAAIASEPPISHGQVSKDTIGGHDVMVVRHRSESGTTAEAWLVSQHGNLTVEINSAMGGAEAVALGPLVREVEQAFRVFVRAVE